VKRHVAGAVGAFLGLVLWLSASDIVGTVEPWASSERTYLFLLVASGAGLALLDPSHFWTVPVGLYCGQLAAILIQAGAPAPEASPEPLVLKPLFLVSYSLPCFVAAAAAAGGRLRWGRRRGEAAGRG
jgi:hypothetical protein